MSQDAPIPPPKPPARLPRLIPRLMLAITLLLGLFVGWQESPREVGRWHLAAAVEHRLNADYLRVTGRSEQSQAERRQAEAALAKALAWYPDGGEIYLERARWRQADGEYAEGLADCDTALRLGVHELPVARLKVDLLASLGRYDDAVKQAEVIYKHASPTWWDPRDEVLGLNAVAYFRALADKDLPQALQEVDAALAKVPAKGHSAAILDTRGYVLYRMGRYDEAMAVFQKALARANLEMTLFNSPHAAYGYLDYRQFAVEKPQHAQSLGVIYYHASRVLEKLNRWKEAKELQEKAKTLLGREPDATLF